MMNKEIPLCLPALDSEEKQAVLEVLNSNWLAHGEYNVKFEKEFAAYTGVKHAITMNSCTSALEIALRVHNIKGEVIIPSFTFVATANAVVNSGAIPVFADVDLDTRNITAAHIEKCLSAKTEAVIVVHYGGQICRMDEITAFCQKHKLLLIEDSAETIGACWKNRKAGSFGIGCFSFFPTKNITTGEGGILTTDDDEINQKVRTLISHGIETSTYARETKKMPWLRNAVTSGYNYRMSNILAAIGYHQIKKLDTLNQKRVELAGMYNTRLAALGLEISLPVTADFAGHVYQMYTILVPPEKRDNLVLALREQGVGASVHFDPPVHQQTFYKTHYPTQGLDNTEKLAGSIITLPMYPGMTGEDIDYIALSIKKVF